jgi:acylphosphatase
MKRLEATIYGRVQGVSFRYYTRREAQKLGLSGWVANQPDGAVRVVAEGDDTALQQFVAYLHQGPAMAHVTQVDMVWAEATQEFSQFSIRGIY